MRTCFGIGEPGDPQFTISAAHCHAVCYGIDSHPMDSRIRLQSPDEPIQTLSRKMYKGTADVPMVLIDKKADCADTLKSPPQTACSRTPDTDGGRNRLYAKRSGLHAEEIR